ncbi:hypothetical protein [Sphingobacterium daejeonense]|uniref:hypothetical protein n=1 Tax=Sphingobacterium daejeonense TaxID=371142 RepID=UPI0010C479F8|nr:hypothetical protein [Sphingobacterium daejeonense]VTQ07158.1 Uncharacterised protein [Sphingobacterium daejeonense]
MTKKRTRLFKTTTVFRLFPHPFDLKRNPLKRYDEDRAFTDAVANLTRPAFELFYLHHLEHFLESRSGNFRDFNLRLNCILRERIKELESHFQDTGYFPKDMDAVHLMEFQEFIAKKLFLPYRKT